LINNIKSDIKKVSLDDWYGVDFKNIAKAVKNEFTKRGIEVEMISTNTLFKSLDEIKEYKQKYITDAPGFGYVNIDGYIQDIMDIEKISHMQKKLKNKQTDHQVIILYGYGAVIKELSDEFDLKYYFDKTCQLLLWEMWDAKLIPFSFENADKEYGWKEFYYCDYYLLRHQKNFIIENMDCYVEAISFDDLKLAPRKAYDEIVAITVKYPIKDVLSQMQDFYRDDHAIVFGCAGLREIMPSSITTNSIGLFMFGEVYYAEGRADFGNLMLSKVRFNKNE
jgi:hypothetical protein